MKIATIRDRALVWLVREHNYKPPELHGMNLADQEAGFLAGMDGLSGVDSSPPTEFTPSDPSALAFARWARDLHVYGQRLVDDAFSFSPLSGNRFNAPGEGAWYCGYDFLTSAAEVGFHRTRELSKFGEFRHEARYVEIHADFAGEFPDLGDERGHSALDPDPEIGYPEGQALALALRREGHAGLLYPSVRHPDGRCFVALDPGVVKNVRPGAKWKFTWNGTPEYSIEGF